MGSGGETVVRTVDALNARGARLGVLRVRLYRPFDANALFAALPATVTDIAVLDRTKEPGASAEPMYLDIITALHEASAAGTLKFAKMPRVIGGRYGLSSKEFTPAMVSAVYDDLAAEQPLNHFTVGITDDVTRLSLSSRPDVRHRACRRDAGGVLRARRRRHRRRQQELDQDHRRRDAELRAGLLRLRLQEVGGRHDLAPAVRAAPNPRAVPGDQGELRRLPPVRVPREVRRASAMRLPAASSCSTARSTPTTVWDELPREVQSQIIEKQLRFYVIDAYAVAKANGMGTRINTVMQTCFFAISGVLPRDEAIDAHQAHHREDLRQAWRRGRAAQLRGG